MSYRHIVQGTVEPVPQAAETAPPDKWLGSVRPLPMRRKVTLTGLAVMGLTLVTVPPPTIASITPDEATQGTTTHVVLTGTGFIQTDFEPLMTGSGDAFINLAVTNDSEAEADLILTLNATAGARFVFGTSVVGTGAAETVFTVNESTTNLPNKWEYRIIPPPRAARRLSAFPLTVLPQLTEFVEIPRLNSTSGFNPHRPLRQPIRIARSGFGLDQAPAEDIALDKWNSQIPPRIRYTRQIVHPATEIRFGDLSETITADKWLTYQRRIWAKPLPARRTGWTGFGVEIEEDIASDRWEFRLPPRIQRVRQVPHPVDNPLLTDFAETITFDKWDFKRSPVFYGKRLSAPVLDRSPIVTEFGEPIRLEKWEARQPKPFIRPRLKAEDRTAAPQIITFAELMTLDKWEFLRQPVMRALRLWTPPIDHSATDLQIVINQNALAGEVRLGPAVIAATIRLDAAAGGEFRMGPSINGSVNVEPI